MIHPSYTELMAVINSEVEEGEQPLVQSRYSIVKATANRAKEIIDARSVEEKIAKARIEANNKEKEKEKDKDKIEEKRISKEDERKLQVGTPLVRCSEKDKPLSIAVKEFYEGKVKILGCTDENTSIYLTKTDVKGNCLYGRLPFCASSDENTSGNHTIMLVCIV